MGGANLNFNFNFNYRGNIMALKKPTPAAGTNFEGGEGENMGGDDTVQISAKDRLAAAAAEREAAAEKTVKPAEKPATSSASREVAAPTGAQVAVSRPMVNPFDTLKDAFPVEFDTLLNLQLNQGNAINKDTNVALGSEIGLELMSFQDQTVISPGVDGADAKEHVRYSDDGITTSKGENVQEYLAELKLVFEKANLSKRVVIVGSLFDPGIKGKKIPGMQDKLVQINLPPSSVSTFKRYTADQAFQIAKRDKSVEGVERMRITMDTKTKGDNTWTVANFTRYDDPVDA